MSKQKSRMRCLEHVEPNIATCRIGKQRRLVQVTSLLDMQMAEICWKKPSVLTEELLSILQGSLRARELCTDVLITVSISIK